MQTPNYSLETLKEHLPHGSLKKVAQKFGFTQVYLSQIMKGEKQNIQVLTELARIAEANKQRKQKLADRLASL